MKNEFASLEELIAFADGPAATKEINSRLTGQKSFTGTDTYAEALALARDGWPEGRAAVEAARVHFEHVIGSRVRRAVTVYDVAGFALDVPAFLQGSPDCMMSRETVEVEGAGRVVRVVVQGAASGDVSTQEITKRGALLVALVDTLESAGLSVELVVNFSATESRRTSSQTLTAKRAGEPVEIDRLAFILAHPAMLRRLIFACYERDAQFMQVAAGNYGYVADAEDRGDLYVIGSDTRFISDGNAADLMRGNLAKLGITFDQ